MGDDSFRSNLYLVNPGAEPISWDPARAHWLTEVFRNGAATIYAVKQR